MKKILQILALIVFIFYCLNANLYKRGTKSSKLTYILNDGNRFRVYKSDSTLFSGLEIKDFGIKVNHSVTLVKLLRNGGKIIKPNIPKNEISSMVNRNGSPFWSCYQCANNTGNILIRHRGEIPYKNGLVNGKMKVFSSDGKLYETTDYINGNAEGIKSSYYSINKNETIFRVDTKFVNGYEVMIDKNNYVFCYDKKNNKIPCD